MTQSALHIVQLPSRIVLDTSVVVSAMRNPDGVSFRLLASCLHRRYEAVITPALFMEYEAVLYRPQHDLHPTLIESFLQHAAAQFEPARIHFNWRPQLTDPDDELVLEAAISGKASIIATYNLRHFLPAANNFGIRVLTPGAIMNQERLR